MKFIHTGVPPLYVNEGICNPNVTLRSHDSDQNSNQSIDTYIAIYHYFDCNGLAEKAYLQGNTGNASLYNSLVMNGGGVA